MEKSVAYAIFVSVGVAILALLLEVDAPALSNAFYSLAGLGMFVFSIWAAILLMRDDGGC